MIVAEIKIYEAASHKLQKGALQNEKLQKDVIHKNTSPYPASQNYRKEFVEVQIY